MMNVNNVPTYVWRIVVSMNNISDSQNHNEEPKFDVLSVRHPRTQRLLHTGIQFATTEFAKVSKLFINIRHFRKIATLSLIFKPAGLSWLLITVRLKIMIALYRLIHPPQPKSFVTFYECSL